MEPPPLHPRGIVVPRRLDDQGRHLRVGGDGALRSTGLSYRGREPVGGCQLSLTPGLVQPRVLLLASLRFAAIDRSLLGGILTPVG